MRDDTRNGIASAQYDLETARHLLAAGRYVYVEFFCHLTLEKILEAHVTEETGDVAPNTHNLIALVTASGLTVPREQLDFLGRISGASVANRYPDDLESVLADYTEPLAQEILRETEQALLWFVQHPRLI